MVIPRDEKYHELHFCFIEPIYIDIFQGRTIGEILNQDINIKGIYLGVSNETNSDPVSQTMISKSFILIQSLTPEWLGKKIDANLIEVVKRYTAKTKAWSKQPPFFNELKDLGYGQEFINAFNSADFFKAEHPSSNFRANARGLGKLASIMANKGQQLMPEWAWEEIHAEPIYATVGSSKSNT